MSASRARHGGRRSAAATYLPYEPTGGYWRQYYHESDAALYCADCRPDGAESVVVYETYGLDVCDGCGRALLGPPILGPDGAAFAALHPQFAGDLDVRPVRVRVSASGLVTVDGERRRLGVDDLVRCYGYDGPPPPIGRRIRAWSDGRYLAYRGTGRGRPAVWALVSP